MFTITEDEVRALAPDSRALAAARKQAAPDKWRRLGRDGEALWGVAVGSKGDAYAVFAKGPGALGCSCPSRKRPCKHSLALLLLAAKGHEFEQQALPAGHRFSGL
ncbi:MAG: SWIM zinc finger family protein [Alphaproteobacteria bacterium]|nr:SWIM zinc finger family protein [Alphaproteobacteria bacterium]